MNFIYELQELETTRTPNMWHKREYFTSPTKIRKMMARYSDDIKSDIRWDHYFKWVPDVFGYEFTIDLKILGDKMGEFTWKTKEWRIVRHPVT